MVNDHVAGLVKVDARRFCYFSVRAEPLDLRNFDVRHDFHLLGRFVDFRGFNLDYFPFKIESDRVFICELLLPLFGPVAQVVFLFGVTKALPTAILEESQIFDFATCRVEEAVVLPH